MHPNKTSYHQNSTSEPVGAKLLVIGHTWPEPKTTAAGKRMMQLLDTFLTNDYEITFASTASRNSYSETLSDLGIQEVDIQLNNSSFDVFIKELSPDAVIFDRFMVEEQFGWRVAESCAEAIRILNTEDLHALRNYREECFKKEQSFSSTGWLRQDKTKRELASIFRSDLTLVVSTFEMQLLQDSVSISEKLLLHLPFLLDEILPKTKGGWPEFEERVDFISFGNGKHAPNVDSFKCLKNEIWPLIRKALPEAKLHVYGAYLPQQVLEMDNAKSGFHVHGWVDDLNNEVRKARVVLAPLRFGAGIKGKLTTSMQCGTPSVTTELGAEGMHGDLPWAGVVANGPKEIAQKAVELYSNREKWLVAQQRGIEIINSQYAKTRLQELLFERLELLKTNLKAHRESNVIGLLIQHQSMAATKFMGKWIEEKNRKN